MRLETCRSEQVLVLSPLEIGKHKGNHPKGLSSAGAPASQQRASTAARRAGRVVGANGETCLSVLWAARLSVLWAARLSVL